MTYVMLDLIKFIEILGAKSREICENRFPLFRTPTLSVLGPVPVVRFFSLAFREGPEF